MESQIPILLPTSYGASSWLLLNLDFLICKMGELSVLSSAASVGAYDWWLLLQHLFSSAPPLAFYIYVLREFPIFVPILQIMTQGTIERLFAPDSGKQN